MPIAKVEMPGLSRHRRSSVRSRGQCHFLLVAARRCMKYPGSAVPIVSIVVPFRGYLFRILNLYIDIYIYTNTYIYIYVYKYIYI